MVQNITGRLRMLVQQPQYVPVGPVRNFSLKWCVISLIPDEKVEKGDDKLKRFAIALIEL